MLAAVVGNLQHLRQIVRRSHGMLIKFSGLFGSTMPYLSPSPTACLISGVARVLSLQMMYTYRFVGLCGRSL